MTEYFPEPTKPGWTTLFHYAHEHDLVEWGAKPNVNGTWSSLWRCTICTDILVGDKVGPIPPGYCPCGWVQRKPGRKKCEECKRPLGSTP